MRGSFRSPRASATTARTASFTLRIRSLICENASPGSVVRRDDQPLAAREHPVAGGQPALRAGCELLGLVRAAGHARDREGGPLPEVLVIDLRNRRSEAVPQVVLRRAHEVALALQGRRL